MNAPIAFVTGATRGIGAASAVALAQQKFQLVLHGRTAESIAETAAKVASASGLEPLVLDYDITDSDRTRDAFQQIFKRYRRLDVLVNNAGVMEPCALGMISRDALHKTLDTNLSAAILHMQGASKLLARAGGGSIVNISSIVGVQGFEGQVAYSASKAGLIGATLSAAKELAAKRIRVNAVAPGYIDTTLNAGHSSDNHLKNLERVRMGRMGTAGEVADLVAFLSSDKSRYITGQVIGIDGGMSL